MHLGCETRQKYHYVAASKSKDGSPAAISDGRVSPCTSFEDFACQREVRRLVYAFAYRRLPPVARGPGVGLKDSLANTKYAKAKRRGEIDVNHDAAGASAEEMDIDAHQRPEEIVMTGVSPPKVAQQGKVTGIELDEKWRGNLVIQFTEAAGATTLRLPVKGMLWNDLKSKPRGHSGGPLTSSMASSDQASNTVDP